jgi:hypothetical protein
MLMLLSEFRDGFLKWFGKGKTIGGSLNWFLALHDDGLFGCLWREYKKSNSIPLLVKVEQKGSHQPTAGGSGFTQILTSDCDADCDIY